MNNSGYLKTDYAVSGICVYLLNVALFGVLPLVTVKSYDLHVFGLYLSSLKRVLLPSTVLYLEDELEFLAHIAPSCSTYEYFGSSKYETLTPSHHGDMKNQYFDRAPQWVLLKETMRFL